MTNTYLITGANRGIGLEMARRVIANGDILHAICRNPSASNELTTLLDNSNGRIQIHSADTCDSSSLDKIANQIKGNIDILVCNAGVMSARGGIDDIQNDLDSVSDTLVTNVAGPFFTTRAFLKNLKNSQNPRIAIISSFMGSQQHEGSNAYFYRASKAGANNIMVTLSNELRSDGITVAAFHPGWVRTDMGGCGADLSPNESASALITQFNNLSLSKTGKFLNYDGKSLPL